jgi:hypothetical protein
VHQQAAYIETAIKKDIFDQILFKPDKLEKVLIYLRAMLLK